MGKSRTHKRATTSPRPQPTARHPNMRRLLSLTIIGGVTAAFVSFWAVQSPQTGTVKVAATKQGFQVNVDRPGSRGIDRGNGLLIRDVTIEGFDTAIHNLDNATIVDSHFIGPRGPAK